MPCRYFTANGSAVTSSQQVGTGRFLPSNARETRRTKSHHAAAHKLARIIFHLVTTRQEFDDARFAADQLRYIKRQESKLRAKAHALGFQLMPLANAG